MLIFRIWIRLNIARAFPHLSIINKPDRQADRQPTVTIFSRWNPWVSWMNESFFYFFYWRSHKLYKVLTCKNIYCLVCVKQHKSSSFQVANLTKVEKKFADKIVRMLALIYCFLSLVKLFVNTPNNVHNHGFQIGVITEL